MRKYLFPIFAILGIALSFSCQKAPFVTLNTPRSFTFTRDGGTQSITFTCNRDWSVSSSESWIQVSPSSGTAKDGEITVKITCTANATYDTRSATVNVKVEELTEAISISQDTGIGLIVSPKTFDLTNAVQTIEIEVQKNVQYNISIDDAGKNWITHTGTKGLTSEKATFSIAANDTYDNREGKITFKQIDGSLSETVVVRQKQNDGLFLTVTEYEVSNESQNLELALSTNVDLTVTPDVVWIKHVETKALSDKKLTLSIEANPTYEPREGKVVIKKNGSDLQVTATIKQKEGYGLIALPTTFDVDVNSQTIEVEVQHNIEWEVVIEEDAKSWITPVETKGLQTSIASFQISKNDGEARTGKIVFTGSGLEQEVTVNQEAWIHVTDITLSKTLLFIAEGDTKTITASLAPDDASEKTIVWTSSNESVATVSEGVVRALKVGEAIITATCDGISKDCSVRVLSESELDLESNVRIALIGTGITVSNIGTYYSRYYRITNNSIVDIDVYEIGTSNFISLVTKIPAGASYDTQLYLSYNVYPTVTVRFKYNGHNYEIKGGGN